MQPIKNGQNGPNRIRLLLRHNEPFISGHLWNPLSTFIPKHFLQNLKNALVAKRTIYGRTLGHPVDWWIKFGDRATIFQQHCFRTKVFNYWFKILKSNPVEGLLGGRDHRVNNLEWSNIILLQTANQLVHRHFQRKIYTLKITKLVKKVVKVIHLWANWLVIWDMLRLLSNFDVNTHI